MDERELPFLPFPIAPRAPLIRSLDVYKFHWGTSAEERQIELSNKPCQTGNC